MHLFTSSKLQKAFLFSHILEQKNLGCGENRRTIRKGRGEGWWKILDKKGREKYKLLKVGKVEKERVCKKKENKKRNCD